MSSAENEPVMNTAAPAGCWKKRRRGSATWASLQMQPRLIRRAGAVGLEYARWKPKSGAMGMRRRAAAGASRVPCIQTRNGEREKMELSGKVAAVNEKMAVQPIFDTSSVRVLIESRRVRANSSSGDEDDAMRVQCNTRRRTIDSISAVQRHEQYSSVC